MRRSTTPSRMPILGMSTSQRVLDAAQHHHAQVNGQHYLRKPFDQPRPLIRDNVPPLLRLPGIVVPGKRRLRRAFALYSIVEAPTRRLL